MVFRTIAVGEIMSGVVASEAGSGNRVDKLDENRGGTWLLRYPTFLGALQYGETEFEALPAYAKLPVLRRVAGEEAFVSSILGDVRVAYVELSTSRAVEVLDRYLWSRTETLEWESTRPATVETLARNFPAVTVPHVARPPCLLSPGSEIFMEGWSRFLAYWARNDKTIPLLAVDWAALYQRMIA
jgi:hypothetical protein